MPFDSIYFWLVFGPFLAVYWCAPKAFKNILLLSMSVFLYAYWDYRFLIPLGISTVTDFFIGLGLERFNRQRDRRLLLSVSIVINLGLLVLFKYLRGSIQYGIFESIILPIGISFYTFQTLSYTIDIYNKKIKATGNFVNFFLYVSFFPQLVAGPIERARRLLPQMFETKKITKGLMKLFVSLILLGLAKKLFLAPMVASHAEYVWHFGEGNILLLCAGGFLTTLQVYLDFSAYSDLARGLAASLGYKIMINFKPFIFSKNPAQFWQNWHISLTTWIRDYLIISTRNRNWSQWLKHLHLVSAMVLVGIWHDLTWNWIAFGLFHGCVLVFYLTIWRRIEKLNSLFIDFAGVLFMMFVYIVSGLLHADYYFGTEIVGQFSNLNTSIVPFFAYTRGVFYSLAPGLIPLFLFEFFQTYKQDYDFILKQKLFYQIIFVGFCLSCIFVFDHSVGTGFIYFDF